MYAGGLMRISRSGTNVVSLSIFIWQKLNLKNYTENL